MIRDIQETLHDISQWCNESSSRINPSKASVMWCSLNNNIVKADLPFVNLNGKNIDIHDTLKYLGITFDRSLSYKYHVDQIIQRCK
jgi:hypothetical protein